MKCAFTFNGCHYLAPSKKEAKKFLRFFEQKYTAVYRFETNWKFKHVERAPSYCHIMKIWYDKVEFANV